MAKISQCKQGSEEWFEKRKGHLTASHGQTIAANGKGLESYVIALLSEKYSSAQTERYTNDDMARGVDLEPVARSIYELTTGNEVEEVGFIEFDKYTLISPDGLIGKDGGVEFKCLNDTNHVKAILFGEKAIDKKYLWQVQMSLLLTKRKYWDLVLFNPNFSQSMLIFRITKDEAMHDKLKKGLSKGKQLIKELEKKINGRTKT